VALLQECPPRWAESLATRCAAAPHLVLTRRNLAVLGSVQRRLADLSPDLIASWEGGCNLTLVRSRRFESPAIVERREHELARRPERRVMAFSRLEAGICVANLHASGNRELAEDEVAEAAGVAIVWAGSAPLLFGGDLNIRPAQSGPVFAELTNRYGLSAPTPGTAIDHLLVRGMDVLSPARQWAPGEREVPDPTAGGATPALPIRLSDHAPVEATFGRSEDAQEGAR
jgi:hypothetical protein